MKHDPEGKTLSEPSPTHRQVATLFVILLLENEVTHVEDTGEDAEDLLLPDVIDAK